MNDRDGEIQRRELAPRAPSTAQTHSREGPARVVRARDVTTRPIDFEEELNHFRVALKRSGSAPLLSRAGRVALRELIRAIAALLDEDA